MIPATDHLLYGLAWLSFGAGHSLLARDSVKTYLRPLLGPWYRLAYNGFAIVHLGLVGWAGYVLYGPHDPFPLPTWAETTLQGFWLLGIAGFLIALRGYDLGRLTGTRQIRNHLRGIKEPEDEALRTDGLHRWVRHPLYAGGLLALWGRIGSEFDLATAVWASLYLWIGTLFEERALLRLYGEAYTDYRHRVPAVIPWKGRVL